MPENLQLEKLNINTKDKVAIIYPHPDDEAFSNAGLIQILIQNNVETMVVILTKGEATTLNHSNSLDITKAREQEFTNVMNELSVKNFSILDLVDGKLKNDPNLRITVQNLINNFKPNVLITFEPCGIYGHPDHIALSNLITELAQKQNIKLIYSTVPSSFKIQEDMLKMAEEPSSIKPIKPNFVLKLSFKQYLKKLKILKMYKSQIKFDLFSKQALFMLFFLNKEYYFVKNQNNENQT